MDDERYKSLENLFLDIQRIDIKAVNAINKLTWIVATVLFVVALIQNTRYRAGTSGKAG